MFSKLPSEVRGLGEFLAGVNVIETRIGVRRFVRRLKTDRQTERFVLLGRGADHILPERSIGQRRVRVLFGIFFHRLVFGRSVFSLAGSPTPEIEVVFAKSLARDLYTELACKRG